MVHPLGLSHSAAGRFSRNSKRDSITLLHRQRMQLQSPPTSRRSWFKRVSSARPPSSIYSEAGDASMDDDSGPRPYSSVTSWALRDRMSNAPVSPPDSFDFDLSHGDLVSPPDDDDPTTPLTPVTPASPKLSGLKPNQIKAYRASRQAALFHSRASRRISTQDSVSAPKAATAKPTPEGRMPWKAAVRRRTNRISSAAGDDDDLYVAPLNIRRSKQQKQNEPATALKSDASETSHVGPANVSTRRPSPLTITRKITSKPLPAGPQTPPDSAASKFHHYSHQPLSPVAASPPLPSPTPSAHATEALAALTRSIKRKPTRTGANVRSPTATSPRQLASRFPIRSISKDVSQNRSSADEPACSPPISRFSVAPHSNSNSNPTTLTESSLPPVPVRNSGARDKTARSPISLSGPRTISVPPASLAGNLNSPGRQPPKSPGARSRDGVPRSFAAVMDGDCGSPGLSPSGEKPLPAAPPELSTTSQDRITQLNVYIESLVHRRLNISRSIQQMTKLMPSDSLFASPEVLRKREAEKLKVQALEDELAEIQCEEYEAGIKLHRAYKRLDRDTEPTSLWVKRVAA